MEHLTIVSDGHLTEHDVVPYVATDEYKTRTLSEWLAVDWPTKRREYLYISPDEVNSLLQTWCFFGLCQQVLGSFFVDTHYITQRTREDGSSHAVLTTARLATCLDMWVEDASKAPVRREHLLLYRQLFREFEKYSRGTVRDVLMRDAMIRPIEISTKTCAMMVYTAVRRRLGHDHSSELPLVQFSIDDIPSVDLSIMQDNGWCPSIATRAWTRFDLAGQMMIRTAPNPMSTRHDHVRCTTQHSRCTQTDDLTFKTVHVEPSCRCAAWSVDAAALDEIIRRDMLPLLQFTLPASARLSRNGGPPAFEEFNLRLVPKSNKVPYIAISHVWAHGAGNPDANALPHCQLSRLMFKMAEFVHCDAAKDDSQTASTSQRQQASFSPRKNKSETICHRLRAGDKVHFWLDTLCCPARPSPAKLMTISKMREIYSNPADVLVFDRCLELLDSDRRPAYELAMYISMSTWAHRVWTLQEAALPKRLWFCFKDSVRSLDWLLSNMIKMQVRASVSIAEDDLLVAFYGALLTMTGGRRPDDGQPRLAWSLGRIAWALAQRSLSVASDEPLILQNLIDTYGVSIAETRSGVGPTGLLSPRSRLFTFLTRSLAGSRRPSTSSKRSGVTVAASSPPIDRDMRMVEFWNTCRSKGMLGDEVIFNVLPRMARTGYRWAPESLMCDSHRQHPGHSLDGMLFSPKASTPTPGDLDQRGFVVALSGFAIATRSPLPIRQQLATCSDYEGANSIVLRYDASGHWYVLYRRDEFFGSESAVDKPSSALTSQFVLIINEEECFGLFASVIGAGTFPESGDTFHHVRGEYHFLVARQEAPFEQLLEELLAAPVRDGKDVSDRLYDMGVAALTARKAPQRVLERRHAVINYVTDFSSRLQSGQYLSMTQKFDSNQGHRWIVD